jgi:structural maintenance of chromosome 4
MEVIDLGDSDHEQPEQINTVALEQPFLEVAVVPEGTYRRLMIEKVELENFKSYFGNKVIGPLHKNFTAVVGPNGSGKSNLIESLLFVFGKRAKQMRLNKLSELIHKSAEHPDVPQASVRVSFQEIIDHENDTDYFEVIPGTKFTVSRQVTKSSTSRYYINNQMTDYTTVCNVLKQKGIDLDHNRFLILQGEVE